MSCTIGWQDPVLAYHMPKEEALGIAKDLTRVDEDGWTYTPLAQAGKHIIGVCDAKGEVLGYL